MPYSHTKPTLGKQIRRFCPRPPSVQRQSWSEPLQWLTKWAQFPERKHRKFPGVPLSPRHIVQEGYSANSICTISVSRNLSCRLPGSSSFSNRHWAAVRISNNFMLIVSRRLAACLVQDLPIIFQEPFERRFGVFIHGADGGYETGGHEAFHSFAELFRRLFSGTRNLGLQRLAPCITSGSTICVERGERVNYAFRRFGECHIHLLLRLPPEFLQTGIHRTFHERLHFRRACIQLRERLFCHDLSILQQALAATIYNHGCRTFKIRCCLGQRFLQARRNLRCNLSRNLLHIFFRTCQLA